jgi:aspartokinase/homoserine dehydrogenase 1
MALKNFRECCEHAGVSNVESREIDLGQQIRKLLDPLKQLLLGMSLLRERTPQALDCVLSFGERLSAIVLTELLCVYEVPAVFVDAR